MTTIGALAATLKDIQPKYSKPMSHLPPSLEEDPVHKYRAEEGIELIHKEPDVKEFSRILINWMLMPEDKRKESDKESKKLYGKTNLEHAALLLRKYDREDD